MRNCIFPPEMYTFPEESGGCKLTGKSITFNEIVKYTDLSASCSLLTFISFSYTYTWKWLGLSLALSLSVLSRVIYLIFLRACVCVCRFTRFPTMPWLLSVMFSSYNENHLLGRYNSLQIAAFDGISKYLREVLFFLQDIRFTVTLYSHEIM